MQCDCIEQIDKQTTKMNYIMKKESFINMHAKNPEITWKPVLYSEVIKKKRGFKAPMIPLQYCPFCGLCAVESKGRVTDFESNNLRIYLKCKELEYVIPSNSLYGMTEVVRLLEKIIPCIKDFDIPQKGKSWDYTIIGYQKVSMEKKNEL